MNLQKTKLEENILSQRGNKLNEEKKIETELFELEFEDWRSRLTKKDRQQYAPNAQTDEGDMQTEYLKIYFQKNFYEKQFSNQEEFSKSEQENSSMDLDKNPFSVEAVRELADQQFGKRK